MKVFTTFIALIIYFFSFVSHNSFMAISSDKDLSNHNIVGISHHLEIPKTNNDSSQNCNLIVDFDQNIQHNSENILKSFVLKIAFDFIDNSFFKTIEKDISYLKINSPPYLNQDIKNYNYTQLIRIIKSNS